MKTHSSILAWKIPWTEEPGGLQSIGSQKRVTHNLQLNNNDRLFTWGSSNKQLHWSETVGGSPWAFPLRALCRYWLLELV